MPAERPNIPPIGALSVDILSLVTTSMSTTAVQANPSTSGERDRRQTQRHAYDFHRVPAPKYRHAAPSAPWPWMNFDIDSSEVLPSPERPQDSIEWSHYPQSLFKNWMSEQVDRSQMLTKCSDSELSRLYKMNMLGNGRFDKRVETRIVRKDDAVDVRACWNYLSSPSPTNVRVQAFFVEDMTLPVLKMLGTRYNVEPFFFASSVNWTPSRYREDSQALEDHITVVLPFIRILKMDRRPIVRTRPMRFPSIESWSRMVVEEPLPYTEGDQKIDTQTPLVLPGKTLFEWKRMHSDVHEENKALIQDLLSLHLVRKTTTSTLISYHPSLQGTSARRLQSLAQRTGDSVYWSKIYKRSHDPTFLLLAILWYALYAWDEAFEVLFLYINALEYKVLESRDFRLTRELHKVQAYLLLYQQFLEEFLQSVEFVKGKPSPAMNDSSISEAEREDSAKLLETEGNNLISEIERLTQQREMLSDRLVNAMRLTFAIVNIEDSNTAKMLAKVTAGDSAALKLIAYLTTIFVPATYLANVFSMNVKGIAAIQPNPEDNPKDTIANYVEATVTLTLLTSWMVVAIQKDSSFFPSDSTISERALWPFFYAYGVMSEIKKWFKSANRRSLHDSRVPKVSDADSEA